MNQFLPRGYKVSNNKKIRKVIAEGLCWQIYLTDLDSYVLAVETELYDRWISEFSLPVHIFSDSDSSAYKIFVSNGDYIVSSLEKGPFPDNSGQIEAFSIAFKTALELYPDANLCDAIYIEEFSLILPTSFCPAADDISIVYGKWITGGIGVSINAFERVTSIMSWLPRDFVRKSAELAGFDITEKDENGTNRFEVIESGSVGGKISENPLPEREFRLVGRPELEQFIKENIIDIVNNQEQYKRMGISFPGATILFGPPGCGKTYAVERLSEYLGWPRFDIDSSTISSPYIHDTSKKISEIFQMAVKSAPSIIVIDEMEAFLSDRGTAGTASNHHVEEVAEFLRRIPEAVSNGVLVFAMTNMIDAIDPAILRRGRFDYIVKVEMANAEEINTLLLYRFKELPISDTVQSTVIASALAGRPLSDVTFVLREAGRIAVKKHLELITQECFDDALALLPKKKNSQTKIGFTAD